MIRLVSTVEHKNRTFQNKKIVIVNSEKLLFERIWGRIIKKNSLTLIQYYLFGSEKSVIITCIVSIQR